MNAKAMLALLLIAISLITSGCHTVYREQGTPPRGAVFSRSRSRCPPDGELILKASCLSEVGIDNITGLTIKESCNEKESR